MDIANKYKKDIEVLVEKIDASNNISIVPHYNPDGDAIGSALALYILLDKLGKQVQVVSPTQTPDFLHWMPKHNIINIIGKNTKKIGNIFNEADMIICVDFNSLNRVKHIASDIEKSTAFKVVIDHHPYPSDFSDLLFSEIEYCATTGLIYEIIENTKYKELIDRDIATCLFVGIMTDTGSFSFNSSTPKTYRIVEKLLNYKVNKDFVYDRIYNSFSFDRMRFMGHVMLNRMVILPELKTGYIYITAKDREDFNEKYGDTENFVNIPLSVKGILFSAIFIERNGFIKISFRSKGDFAVNKFSEKYFNGGGHVNASGGESYESLQETTTKFVDILKNEYAEILKTYKY